MSVAFRRESDEEHKEPKFELPLPPGPNIVTPRGLALIRVKIEAIESAVASAPDEAQREALTRDLRYWRTREATAQVAPPATGERVAIGTRVTIRQDGRDRTLEVVGHDEGEPAAGRVPFAAPLAHALLGAEVGDSVELNGGRGTAEVIAIEPLRY